MNTHQFHKKTFIADLHNDIPYHIYLWRQAGERRVLEKVYLPDMAAGGVNLIVAAVCVMEEDLHAAKNNAKAQVEALLEDAAACSSSFAVCTSFREVMAAHRQNKIAFLLALEGNEPIETLDDLEEFYQLGVRINALTWSRTNKLSDGCDFSPTDTEKKRGLTPYGKEVLLEMKRLGMVADVTHISEEGFWQVLDMGCPVLASHTNTQAHRGIRRNFTDEQLVALAIRGGVCGFNGVGALVCVGSQKRLEAACKHIAHMKEAGGPFFPALGLDLFQYHFETTPYAKYPGEIPPDTLYGYKDLPVLTQALLEEGFSTNEIAAIYGGNVLRFLEKHLS